MSDDYLLSSKLLYYEWVPLVPRNNRLRRNNYEKINKHVSSIGTDRNIPLLSVNKSTNTRWNVLCLTCLPIFLIRVSAIPIDWAVDRIWIICFGFFGFGVIVVVIIIVSISTQISSICNTILIFKNQGHWIVCSCPFQLHYKTR